MCLPMGLMFGFSGCRSVRSKAKTTHLRHHKCVGRDRIDRERIKEQHQMEVSSVCGVSLRLPLFSIRINIDYIIYGINKHRLVKK